MTRPIGPDTTKNKGGIGQNKSGQVSIPRKHWSYRYHGKWILDRKLTVTY